MISGLTDKHKIILTGDGSKTIYVPSLDEHYHSTHGAVQESMHVFIKNGMRGLDLKEINVFEMGLGTGLNVLLTIIESAEKNIRVRYSAIEKYPLASDLISGLDYPEILGKESRLLFDRIHSCPWNSFVDITGDFSLRKINDDIRSYVPDEHYNLIYFDAFACDKQPGMWTDDIIGKLAGSCIKGSVFVTYSARGELKRQLKGHRFIVEHPAGPPGKRQMTRAVKY